MSETTLNFDVGNVCDEEVEDREMSDRLTEGSLKLESGDETTLPNIDPSSAEKRSMAAAPPKKRKPYRRTKRPVGYNDRSSVTTTTERMFQCPQNVYDVVLQEANDLLTAAQEAQQLGRLKMTSSYLLLVHARLVGLGKRFDKAMRAVHQQQPSTSTHSATPTPTETLSISDRHLHGHSLEPSTDASSCPSDASHVKSQSIVIDSSQFSASSNAATTTSVPAKEPGPEVVALVNERNVTLSATKSPALVIDRQSPPNTSCANPTKPEPDVVATATTEANPESKDNLPSAPSNAKVNTDATSNVTTTETQNDNISATNETTASLAAFLAKKLPTNIEFDSVMMEHLAKAAAEFHAKRSSHEGISASAKTSTIGNTNENSNTTSTTSTTSFPQTKNLSKNHDFNSSCNSNHQQKDDLVSTSNAVQSPLPSNTLTDTSSTVKLKNDSTSASANVSSIAWTATEIQKLNKIIISGQEKFNPKLWTEFLPGRSEQQIRAYLRNHTERARVEADLELPPDITTTTAAITVGDMGIGSSSSKSGNSSCDNAAVVEIASTLAKKPKQPKKSPKTSEPLPALGTSSLQATSTESIKATASRTRSSSRSPYQSRSKSPASAAFKTSSPTSGTIASQTQRGRSGRKRKVDVDITFPSNIPIVPTVPILPNELKGRGRGRGTWKRTVVIGNNAYPSVSHQRENDSSNVTASTLTPPATATPNKIIATTSNSVAQAKRKSTGRGRKPQTAAVNTVPDAICDARALLKGVILFQSTPATTSAMSSTVGVVTESPLSKTSTTIGSTTTAATTTATVTSPEEE